MRARGVGIPPSNITPANLRRGLLAAGHEEQATPRTRPKNRAVLIAVGLTLLYAAVLWFLEVPW